jgi:hypothetical protein
MPATLELLTAGLLAVGSGQSPTTPPPQTQINLAPGDRIDVTDERQTIRGRIAELTSESLVLVNDDGRRRLALPSVQQIDRVGDPLWNGTAIGAAVGGGSALAAMAKACSNTNCSDTSANLDPRITLLGTLIGAGVGAAIDAMIDGRRTVYRAGQPEASQPAPTVQPSRPHPSRFAPTVFGRVGWARLTDDEGSLGGGTTMGVGVIVPIWRRVALQVAYDRHDHRRDLESGAPPGIVVTGGFTGTEQLVTAKALFYFREGAAVRPYAGIGVGYLDSERQSEFPTFVLQPGNMVVSGPPEIFRYHTTGAGLGFAAGVDARVTRRLSLLGDLTLDLNQREALGSTRLTVGVGWKF